MRTMISCGKYSCRCSGAADTGDREPDETRRFYITSGIIDDKEEVVKEAVKAAGLDGSGGDIIRENGYLYSSKKGIESKDAAFFCRHLIRLRKRHRSTSRQ